MSNERAGFVVAVVDDDQSVLDSLGLLLESADYQVHLFTSGTALLESGCLPEIHCLISDIDMPGMDGFELLQEVHATRTGLPAILITGYADTFNRSQPVDRINTRFFSKPLKGPELLSAIGDSIGTTAS